MENHQLNNSSSSWFQRSGGGFNPKREDSQTAQIDGIIAETMGDDHDASELATGNRDIQKMLTAHEKRLTDHIDETLKGHKRDFIEAVCEAISTKLEHANHQVNQMPVMGHSPRITLHGPHTASQLSVSGPHTASQLTIPSGGAFGSAQSMPHGGKQKRSLNIGSGNRPSVMSHMGPRSAGLDPDSPGPSPQPLETQQRAPLRLTAPGKRGKATTFRPSVASQASCDSAASFGDSMAVHRASGMTVDSRMSDGLSQPEDEPPSMKKRTTLAQKLTEYRKGKANGQTNIFDSHNSHGRKTGSNMSLGERWKYFKLSNFVHSKKFDMGTAGLILSNSIFIGFQTDWTMQNIGAQPTPALKTISLIYMVAFSIELLLRIASEKKKFLSRDNQNLNWNVFDSLLVISSWVEEIMTSLNTTDIDMSAMQMLRITRLIRVLRVIRVMRVFSDLRKMVQGIISSLRSLVWCLLLLLLIMFTFGVAFMQVAAGEMEKIQSSPDADHGLDLEEIYRHFGSLMGTIFTLYMSICGGLDWSEASNALMTIHPIMGGLFAVYIAFAVFCVLNIVTGVFVENATKITQQNDTNAIMDELAIRDMWSEEVESLFRTADADASGELDWAEFEICLNEERVQKYFRRMGLSLDPESVYALFQLLDFDGDGTVDMHEFVEGCTHVHGNARSLDVVRLRHENRVMKGKIDEMQQFLEGCMQTLIRQSVLPGTPVQGAKRSLGKKSSSDGTDSQRPMGSESSDGPVMKESSLRATEKKAGGGLKIGLPRTTSKSSDAQEKEKSGRKTTRSTGSNGLSPRPTEKQVPGQVPTNPNMQVDDADSEAESV